LPGSPIEDSGLADLNLAHSCLEQPTTTFPVANNHLAASSFLSKKTVVLKILVDLFLNRLLKHLSRTLSQTILQRQPRFLG